MKYKRILQGIKKILLDPYVISTLFFTIWMLFFDYQNIFTQSKLYKKLKKLEEDRMQYNLDIQQLKQFKKEWGHNKDQVEKLAREKYYMKREREDVYVIIPE